MSKAIYLGDRDGINLELTLDTPGQVRRYVFDDAGLDIVDRRLAGPPTRVAGAPPGEPPRRNPLFRDREEELKVLRTRLTSGGSWVSTA
jgi:hypothetical protein